MDRFKKNMQRERKIVPTSSFVCLFWVEVVRPSQQTCAHPEGFVRGGPTLYFCDEGKEDPDTTKSRPLFSRQQNAIKMAFHRRADDGPTLNAGLVAI